MIRRFIALVVGIILMTTSSGELRSAEIDTGWVTELRTTPLEPARKVRTRALRAPTEINSSGVEPSGSTLPKKEHALDGIASFYWQDLYTASGEIFDKSAMTAAHPTLPFGTVVEVTNLGNGRSAIVRINDRGPFIPGRVIDVSQAAADALGMRLTGLAPVRINIVTASAEGQQTKD